MFKSSVIVSNINNNKCHINTKHLQITMIYEGNVYEYENSTLPSHE